MIKLRTGPWNIPEYPDSHGKKVFSIFHCGGGSTMGYKLAGFDVLGGVEIDPKIMAIYRKNHKPKYSFLEGIQSFNERKEIPKELFSLDILDGSPPCSSFSMAGAREKFWGKSKKFREGQSTQILDDLFFHFIAAAKKLRPKIIVSENVKGLIFGNAKFYVKEIFKEFDSAGYDTQLFLLNSSKMGVPQKRERTFFISRRKDLNFPKLKLDFHEDTIPFQKSISDIEDQIGKKVPASLLGASAWMLENQTDEVVEWAKQIHGKEKFFTIKGTLPNQPVKTLTASSRHIFFGKDRFLSDLECIRIQTFPDNFDFLDQDAGYVCGMSVPPFMMQRVALEIYKQFFEAPSSIISF